MHTILFMKNVFKCKIIVRCRGDRWKIITIVHLLWIADNGMISKCTKEKQGKTWDLIRQADGKSATKYSTDDYR